MTLKYFDLARKSSVQIAIPGYDPQRELKKVHTKLQRDWDKQRAENANRQTKVATTVESLAPPDEQLLQAALDGLRKPTRRRSPVAP